MAVTDYKVIRVPLDHLELTVKVEIDQGWQPIGAPVIVAPSQNEVYQALQKGTADGGGPVTIYIDSISDASTLGKELLGAETQADARTAIGAGTSNLAVGTGATDAKAGNYQPTWAQVSGKPQYIAAGETQADARTAIGAGTSNLAVGTGATDAKAGNYQPTWAQVSGKPQYIAAGETQADARTAIGAGTSNLAVGTGATDAAAGNHNHAVTADAGSGLAAAANIQALAVALSTRIKALEDAPGV